MKGESYFDVIGLVQDPNMHDEQGTANCEIAAKFLHQRFNEAVDMPAASFLHKISATYGGDGYLC